MVVETLLSLLVFCTLLEQLITNSSLIRDVLCIFVHSMAKFINLLSFFKVVPMVQKSHVLTRQITTVGYLLSQIWLDKQ